MVTGKVCTLNIKLQCKSTSLQRVHLACGLLGLWVVAWKRFVVAERQPCISGNPQKKFARPSKTLPTTNLQHVISLPVSFLISEHPLWSNLFTVWGNPWSGLARKFVQHNAKTHVAICGQQVCKGTTTCDTHDENYSSFRNSLGEYDTTKLKAYFYCKRGI